MDRQLFNAGIFFIVLGSVPLATQEGWVRASTVADLFRFWPLALVAIGVGLLLRQRPAGGLIVALSLGLTLGGLLAVGSLPVLIDDLRP